MAWEEDIFREIRKMRKQFDNFFGGGGFGGFDEEPLRVNLSDEVSKDSNFRAAESDFQEKDNEYVVKVELPGIKKEDIKVNKTDRGLEIKAGTKREKEEGGEEEGEYKSFKSFSGFYQAIDLPEDADTDKINASYENGLLTLSIPKKEKSDSEEPREIQIN